jgi:hypothetical protein
MSTNQNIDSFAIKIWARCMDLLRSRCLQRNFVLRGNFKQKVLIKKVWVSALTCAVLLMNSSTLLMEEPCQQIVLPLAPKTRRYTLDERCRYSQQDGKLNLTKMYGYHKCVRACIRAKGWYWELRSSDITQRVVAISYRILDPWRWDR